MAQDCEREVIELHRFFERWFSGELPDTDEAFARFESVMGSDFEIISPSGKRMDRSELIDSLRGAHGRWSRDRIRGRIWIEDVNVRYIEGQNALVLYEEWQEIDGQTRGRLSSAVFSLADGAPNGVVWRHLHEVWLPE